MYHFLILLFLYFVITDGKNKVKFIADRALKVLNEHMKEKMKQWVESPDFLYQPAEIWELNQDVSFLKTGDPEVERHVNAVI